MLHKQLVMPFVALVRLYQMVLSPLIGRQCRFQPTCSHYMIGALQRFGVIKGLYLGSLRLLSCHAFTKLGGQQGFDPVPQVFSLRPRRDYHAQKHTS